MKKIKLSIILLICLITICGCSKEDKMDNERTVPTSKELYGKGENRSYDMDMAVEKKLNKKNTEFSDKYIYMQDLYKKIFSDYIKRELNLEKYNTELSESKLNFISLKEEKKDMYFKYDKLGLKYFYIQNNFPIERLSEEDLQLLNDCMENKTETMELIEMVERTFPEIITKYIITPETHKDVETFYTSSMNQSFVPIYSLVLVLSTRAEYDEDGEYVDYQNEINKDEYLEAYVKEMEKELNGKLGDMPIRILCPNIPFMGNEW